MEKINIAELLKDCPHGMELDCAICENVYFNKVDSGLIKCFIKNDVYENIYFYRDGTCISAQNAKCVIFPKGKTTWEGFQGYFKDGDIVAANDGTWIGITTGGANHEFIPTYCVIRGDGEFEAYFDTKETWSFSRLATEEEKEKLFKAIKDNGYKWNAETKTLDKLIVTKFKVGDRIRHKILNKNDIYEISRVYDDSYGIVGFTWMIYMKYQDNYELVSVEPKFKVGDRIVKKAGSSIYVPVLITSVGNDCYYSNTVNSIGYLKIAEQDDWELVPNKFDITTLKPFESKVLVRDVDHHEWEGAIFGRYDGKKFFTIGGLDWRCCIPYEGNEHLLGTTNDCDDCYKIWDLK